MLWRIRAALEKRLGASKEWQRAVLGEQEYGIVMYLTETSGEVTGSAGNTLEYTYFPVQ